MNQQKQTRSCWIVFDIGEQKIISQKGSVRCHNSSCSFLNDSLFLLQKDISEATHLQRCDHGPWCLGCCEVWIY